jgi:hypothetical protein
MTMAKKTFATLLIILVVGLSWAFALNQGSCGQVSGDTSKFESSYTFTIQNGYYPADHTLFVSLSHSVRDYYAGKIHTINTQMDYVKFVTPSAVQSLAENMRAITRENPYNDEQFANAVLMVVREITYVKSNAKYPVETLVSDKADCDGLSILAASLMKAGGLDIVLLLYNGISPSHMNIGVSLKQMPVSHSWWASPAGIDYNNKTYWVAECTSLSDWTVGNQPKLIASTEPQIIPLTNCEKNSPAQVSSSLDSPMQSSTISIKLAAVHSEASDGARIVNVSGSISPALPNQTVALYVNQPNYEPTVFKIVTDESGNYTKSWNVTLPGTYIMKTSWSGSFNLSGSDSDAVTVFIGAQQPLIAELSSEISDRQVSEMQYQQYSPWYLTLLNKGSKEFLKSNLTGTDIVLSGDFMVLSDGHEISPKDTIITIPAHPRTYRLTRSRGIVTIVVPEEVIMIPGAERLDSHFGFILKQNVQDNYTASVKSLNGDDLSQINQSLDESNAVFINASNVAAKETWYKAIAKVSRNYLEVEVRDENGTRLDRISQSKSSQDLSALGVFMTYQTGQIIAFKNLNVEAITHNTPTIALEADQGGGFEFLYPFVRVSLLSAGTVLAIVCLWQRRKKHYS